MTRNDDQYISLDDRVQGAGGRRRTVRLDPRRHADGGAGVSGTTVYTCSDKASDAEAQRIAERENAADKQAGEEHKAADPGVADILFDLKRRETRVYAHRFSRGLVAKLNDAGELNRHPERSAGFVVLKAPDFPRCWSSSAISPTPRRRQPSRRSGATRRRRRCGRPSTASSTKRHRLGSATPGPRSAERP